MASNRGELPAKSKLKKSKLKKLLEKSKAIKKKKPYKYGIKEIIKDTGEDIKQMGKDIVDPETYKSVAEGYKMVGSDIVSGVKKYFGKEKTVADPKIKRKIQKDKYRGLKRKKYDLKYSPGPGKATLEKQYGPRAPLQPTLLPPPQDPKHFKEIRPRFAGGGKALRGLGRAFVKGGKV